MKLDKAGFQMSAFGNIFEAIVLATTLSVDAFIASLAYGSDKIRIPFSSIMAINLICGGILGVSLLLGNWVRPYLSEDLNRQICFWILFCFGFVFNRSTCSQINLFQACTKKCDGNFQC